MRRRDCGVGSRVDSGTVIFGVEGVVEGGQVARAGVWRVRRRTLVDRQKIEPTRGTKRLGIEGARMIIPVSPTESGIRVRIFTKLEDCQIQKMWCPGSSDSEAGEVRVSTVRCWKKASALQN